MIVPTSSLLGFALLALGMVLTPGPNMVYVVSRSVCQGRKAGLAYLDSYESTLNRLADFEEKVGKAGDIEWITELANAQATFIRDVTAAYPRAARDMLK